MRLIGVLLFVLALAVGADDLAPLTVSRLEAPDGLAIWAENHQGAEVTVTIESPAAANVECDPPLPLTITIPGGERSLVCRVRAVAVPWACETRWFWTWGPLEAEHDDSCIYRLPFTGRHSISQGYNGSFSHTGDNQYALDFDMPLGTPVLACRAGMVVAVEESYDRGGIRPYFRNRVNKVLIKHSDGTLGEYDHFRCQGVEVQVGDILDAGALLGYSGATGYVSGPHLHFMVYKAVSGRQRQSFPTRFAIKGVKEPALLEQGRLYSPP